MQHRPPSSARNVHHFQANQVSLTNISLPISAKTARQLGLAGLYCGCGANLKPGCLNTDEAVFLDRRGNRSQPRVVVLVDDRCHYLRHDATQRFPIENAVFDWVYTEHVIEHMHLREGIALLREVHRLLKRGGFIRLSTPDLARYVVGYVEAARETPQAMEEGWYEESRDRRNGAGGFLQEHARRLETMGVANVPRRSAWLVNQIFYRWGHRWIYDFAELQFAAAKAGFCPDDVRRCRFRQGRLSEVAAFDLALRNDESLYVEIAKR